MLVRAKAALDALAARPATTTTADTTPPVIRNVTSTVTNATAGNLTIRWTTNEPATSDVR